MPMEITLPETTAQGQTKIPDQSDRLAWLAWRKGGIGGSDAATILGENKYSSPLDLYIDKTTSTVSDHGSLACDRGIAMEPLVAERYASETGKSIRRQPSRIHPDHAFIRCSMDYQIFRDDDRPTGMLECKTANAFVFKKMKLDGLLMSYWVQCQHNMMVCGYSWGAIAILQPDSWEFVHFEIERDDEFCATLLQREIEFWHLVESRTPPEIATPTPVTLPSFTGSLIHVESLDAQLVAGYRDITDALVVAKGIKADADALYDQTKKKVQQWMDRNNFDVVEGFGQRVYYREQAGRKSFDKKALALAHPEINLADFEKHGAPFRTFRVFPTNTNQLAEGVAI